MTKTNSATLLALSLLIPATISLSEWVSGRMADAAEQPAIAETVNAADGAEWVASAPGRVEPKGGDLAVGATMSGRVITVRVEEGQKVARGDIMVQLDDEGTTARFQAARIEALRAKKDRDDIGGGDGEYRLTEDDIVNAEVALWNARDVLDRAAGKRRSGENSQNDLDEARKSYVTAQDLVATKRNALVDLQARKKRPNPNRQEAALAAARSEQSIAAALSEKTHIAKVGETVTPSPDQVLVTVGDVSKLRVKAEVDERDVGRVKVGQAAIVRADAFQGQDFTGKVTTISPSLSSPGLKDRGAARRTDVDVLEIFVDLDAETPLIPGLRVDVFFKSAAPAVVKAPAAAGAPEVAADKAKTQ
jgi:HlyD family secretion protein